MKYAKITVTESCMLRTLHQVGKVKISEIVGNNKKYPGFARLSPATIYRHAKKPLDGTVPFDRRHSNPGRRQKIHPIDLRQIKRQISVLRLELGSFTSKQLQESAGLTHQLSNSAFRRYLHKLGYGYRRTRKKGLLTLLDAKKRLRVVRKIKRLYRSNSMFLWTKQISMYIDGVGYEYKSNPYEHSKTPAAREWRLKNEGLNIGCTTKGKKEGVKQVKFMVGISYNKGVVMCQRITRRMDGARFARMIKGTFPAVLENTINPSSKHILQDGDPAQNSQKALRAFHSIGARVFGIPARSPDLNPIENFFHLIRRKLLRDAKEKHIVQESEDEFAQRVTEAFQNYSYKKIDKIIETMPKRVNMIYKCRGRRIKY